MCNKKDAEVKALRELAVAVDDLLDELPRFEKQRRDRGGFLGYTPHTLSLFRCVWRKLKKWKKSSDGHGVESVDECGDQR